MIQRRSTRREFLKSASAGASGLLLSYSLPAASIHLHANTLRRLVGRQPDCMLQVTPSGEIVVYVNKIELGQGLLTVVAQFIAEELEVDWQTVRVVSGEQPQTQIVRGPSRTSPLATNYRQYCQLAATARELLISAAAYRWDVPSHECRAERGFVLHSNKGRLAYADLCEAASQLNPPMDVRLKRAGEHKVIGKSIPRQDANSKSTGKAVYGLDVRIPGLCFVTVLRPPVFGASLLHANLQQAKKVPGVVTVERIGNIVAVAAKNSWVAQKAREQIQAQWTNHRHDKMNEATLLSEFRKLSENPRQVLRHNEEARAEVAKAKDIIKAEFTLPYLAHAAMEPLSCTINYDGRKAEIWAGHQVPSIGRIVAAQELGLAPEKITINTPFIGGNFGRRNGDRPEFIIEACRIAKRLKRPIQVLWTREDDMGGGQYRPMYVHVARVVTDANGSPRSWHHTFVGQPIPDLGLGDIIVTGKADISASFGGLADSAYAIPKFHVDYEIPQTPIPALSWRSLGHSHSAFAIESMMDELAEKAGQDPFVFRTALLRAHPRHLDVLKALADMSEWKKKRSDKVALGMAVHQSFHSVIGHVVEVSLQDARPRVHRVWTAADCGTVVNPNGARAQIEGAIAFGLSAALYGRIKIENGRAVTSNFHDYQIVRMNEMPEVDIRFLNTANKPTAIGEPSVPPVAPAVANALYKLTGRRFRNLPLTQT